MKLVIYKSYINSESEVVDERITVFTNQEYEFMSYYLEEDGYEYDRFTDLYYKNNTDDRSSYYTLTYL